MELTLILGPMKSGKSFDLISYFAPLRYTDIPHILFQSARNVRDEHICSRNGVVIQATKVQSLREALGQNYKIIGVDEIHMFDPGDVAVVEQLLKEGARIIVAGLDTDYRGKMFDIVKGLFELGPAEVKYKRAVCEICKSPSAIYSQVLRGNVPLTGGMPAVIPDDGTFSYKAVCRNCFVRE